ncbi:MAG: InlB B-repeat-containing protein [Lachnospiraceae bacterium]|nr:InlB B-repeat-containing protein [Lachnospiraceae bacterium]
MKKRTIIRTAKTLLTGILLIALISDPLPVSAADFSAGKDFNHDSDIDSGDLYTENSTGQENPAQTGENNGTETGVSAETETGEEIEKVSLKEKFLQENEEDTDRGTLDKTADVSGDNTRDVTVDETGDMTGDKSVDEIGEVADSESGDPSDDETCGVSRDENYDVSGEETKGLTGDVTGDEADTDTDEKAPDTRTVADENGNLAEGSLYDSLYPEEISEDFDNAADKAAASLTKADPDRVPVTDTPFTVKIRYHKNAPKNSAIGGRIPSNRTVFYPNHPNPDNWNYSSEDDYGGTHHFIGWYADKKYTIPVTNVYQGGFTKNKTLNLYAGWEARTYHITYKYWGTGDMIDCEASELPTEGTCGKALSLKNVKPALPAPYIFKNWYTGTSEKASDKVTKIPAKHSGDITLYAYCDFDYRIVLHGQDSEQIRVIPAKAFTSKKLTAFKKLKWDKEDCFFAGWSTVEPVPDSDPDTLPAIRYKDTSKVSLSKSGTLYADVLNSSTDEEGFHTLDLYAVYTGKDTQQKVVFVNGEEKVEAFHAMGTAAGKTFFKENTAAFHAPKGYRISGWKDTFTGKTLTSIPKTDYRPEITLNAVYSAKKVHVTYYNNAPAITGTKASKKSKDRSFGSGSAFLKNPFKVTGYSFAYWSLDPEGTQKIALSGKKFLSGEEKDAFHDAVVPEISSKKPMTVSLYANWTPNTYTYLYDDDADGTFDEIIEDTYNNLLTDGLRTPELPPKSNFLGWKLYKTDKDGTVKFSKGKPVRTKTALKKIAAKSCALYAAFEQPLIDHEVEVPDDAINVLDYGAIPNDGKDDRQAITNAIAAASPCSEENPNATVPDEEIKTVYIPAGTFDIKIKPNARGIDLYGDDWNDNPENFHPFRSNYVRILMENNTVLLAHASGMGSTDPYSLFYLRFTDHVTIEGGILNGNRSAIKSSGLEHIIDASGAKNLNISYTAMINSYGDGVYLGESYKRQPDNSQKLIRAGYVTIDNCLIKNSRRNNIAIVGADNVTVSNCTILDAVGLQPMCGIDIEPNPVNGKRTPCKHILIENTRIHAKKTGDWYNYFCVNILGGAGQVCAKDVTFRNCRFEGDVYIGCMEKSSFHEENVTVTGTYYKEWN